MSFRCIPCGDDEEQQVQTSIGTCSLAVTALATSARTSECRRAGALRVSLKGSIALSVVAECAGVSRSVTMDVADLMGRIFWAVCAGHRGCRGRERVIAVRARTPGGLVACPSCGVTTSRVHGYHERIAADAPVDGRRVRNLAGRAGARLSSVASSTSMSGPHRSPGQTSARVLEPLQASAPWLSACWLPGSLAHQDHLWRHGPVHRVIRGIKSDARTWRSSPNRRMPLRENSY